MKVVFTPKDGERREWPFDPDDIEMMDASFIKKQTHMNHSAWKKALLEQDADALHGLLWVMLKQENPLFRWTDVRFRMSELEFEFDDDEVSKILERLASMSPEESSEPDALALVVMLEGQGVDVQARLSELAADPEFDPRPAGDAEDPKA